MIEITKDDMYGEGDTCEHGMSAWLCAHPIYHYPTDEMMMRGQYY